MKKRKTSIKRSRVFQIALKGGENRNFCLRELLPFNAFVMQKATFSKHWLINDVKKNDTTTMTTTTNEADIGWLNKNYYLMGEGMKLLIEEDVNSLRKIFLVGKMSRFLAVNWYSSPSPGFPIKV